MHDWPLPKQTKVYVIPSTSSSNVHSASDGGEAAWNALGEDVRAACAAREWAPSLCATRVDEKMQLTRCHLLINHNTRE